MQQLAYSKKRREEIRFKMVMYSLLFDSVTNPLYILGKLVRNLLCKMKAATASPHEIMEIAASEKEDKLIWQRKNTVILLL